MSAAKRVLVVDDDAGIRRVVRTCLEGDGYRIEETSDGATALEILSRQSHDLILLDIAMPVLDGLSVLADIHKSLPPPLPRVIVMTAHGSVRNAINAIRLGAADFLEKPFAPAELRQSVSNAFANVVKTSVSGSGDELLETVRNALRQGKYYTAEAALSRADPTASDGDPNILNLMGVLHEAHGRRGTARDHYEKAIAINTNHPAARKNLTRLDQIEQRGSTQLEVALGDETIDIKV